MIRAVLRGVLVAVAALALAPAAAAEVGASARATAPLRVEFTGTGASTYVWDFGDGTTATGATVEHAYAQPGRYTATVTTDVGTASVEAVAYRLVFDAPARASYDGRARFSGSIWPAAGAVPVEIVRGDGSVAFRGRTRANGGFVLHGRVRSRGPFRARVAGIESEPDAVALRPSLEARVAGTGAVGQPLRIVARVRPAGAGTIDATVWRNGRRAHAGPYSAPLALATGAPATYRVRLVLRPAAGYLGAARTLETAVVRPQLARGSRGPSVLGLEQRLAALGYALPRVDRLYGHDTYEAVLAFQKVHGLPRTGRVDARLWSRIARATRPRARYAGTHIEVSKDRQVMFVVRNGRVESVVHVSTGATGNTPLGRWRIYRKNAGWDWVLWYPMYFLRGFAVHGYPSVPPYPASHGCVRVPMWIAPRLYRQFTYGQTVYIYR